MVSFCLSLFLFFLSGCQLYRGQQSLQIEEQNATIRATIKANNLKSKFRQNKKIIITQKEQTINPLKSSITKYIPIPVKEVEKKELKVKSEFHAPDVKDNLSFMEFLTGPVKGRTNTFSNSQFVPPPATSDTIRIGILLPLTGPNAELGTAMLNATKLAMFDFADLKFELLIHDTKGEKDVAMQAAELAVGDGVSLILGPLLSPSVKAASIAARAANVPILAFSNDQSVAGEGVFTFGFFPEAQVKRVVKYANLRGISRYGVLAPRNAYGFSIVKSLKDITSQTGSSVNEIKFYDPFNSDYSEVVKKLADYDRRRQALLDKKLELQTVGGELAEKALKRLDGVQTLGDLPFDALLVADGGNRLLSIAALLPFYGIDTNKIKILGTGQWDEVGIGKEPALVGAWFAAPPPKSRKNFEAQYIKAFKTPPPRLATLAYDATALAAIFVKNGGREKIFSVKALTESSGFLGRDGIFRLMPNGITDRGLAVLQVGVNSNMIISDAPKTFRRSIN